MISTPRGRPLREVDFDHLLSHVARPSVSIFIGNDQPWPANRRSKLALKAQVKKAREHLAGFELEKGEEEKLLAPLDPWLDEGERWQNVARSLAIYLSKDDFKIYEVDLRLMDSVHVGSVYDVRPLLPLKGVKDFYLLGLSQTRVDLLCVELSVHNSVEIGDVPKSFDEFTQFDETERFLQSRTFQTAGPQKNALYHGHGGAKDNKKVQLDQFARTIAHGVGSHLQGKSSPLIVVGLNPLASMYMEHNNYPHVLFVWEKDPTSYTEQELVDEVRREHLKWHLDNNEEIAEKILSHHVSHPRAESRVSEIVSRAWAGHVDRLLIRQQDYVWGRFEPFTQEKAEVVRAHLPGTEDLLNRAAIYTLQHGGEVYLFDPLKFQAPEHALAVLR